MIEKIYEITTGNNKTIEKIVDDNHVNINHMILNKDEALPLHFANSNVYMVIVRGNLTLALNEKEFATYTYGQIINIPYKTKMNVSNTNEQVLEFFVVKSPNPRHYND
ncbi:MAG: cupin domain-containing protein [Clostridiales bacterium]|nr:cupin domain-containing protein [Clostridiales bacterium]